MMVVWRCACDFDIIVNLILLFFSAFELSYFLVLVSEKLPATGQPYSWPV